MQWFIINGQSAVGFERIICYFVEKLTEKSWPENLIIKNKNPTITSPIVREIAAKNTRCKYLTDERSTPGSEPIIKLL